MKYLLNTILTTILCIIFTVIYINQDFKITYYSLYTKCYLSQKENILKTYIFSYDYDNLFNYDLFDYQLMYHNNTQRIEKIYSKYIKKIEHNNSFLYLYELGFRVNLKEIGLYKDSVLKAHYLDKIISFNIGDIVYHDYIELESLKYVYEYDQIINIDLTDFTDIDRLIFDDITYDVNDYNIYVKLDNSIIEHNIIIHTNSNSYIHKFNTPSYNDRLSDYFRYLMECEIYDKS